MAKLFTEDFWLGSEANYKPQRYQYDPGAFGTGETGAELQRTMMGRVRGEAPSVAELQMQRGMGRALQASRAMQGSATGISPGLAQRLAGQRSAQIMGEGNLAMGQMRAQEQAAAEAQMMQWLENERQAQMALQAARAGEQGRIDQLMAQQAMANIKPGMLGSAISAFGQGLGSLTSSGAFGGGGAGMPLASSPGFNPNFGSYGFGSTGMQGVYGSPF